MIVCTHKWLQFLRNCNTVLYLKHTYTSIYTSSVDACPLYLSAPKHEQSTLKAFACGF